MTDRRHGDQFDERRYERARAPEEHVLQALRDTLDPHNIVPVEPDRPDEYDNFGATVELHQLLDFAGIDYVLDPFDGSPSGVNHRTHSAESAATRFDLRRSTGTAATAEEHKIETAPGTMRIAPAYATRCKADGEGGAEWIKIVDLREWARARDEGLNPSMIYSDTDGTAAALYDYDALRAAGAVVAEVEP